MTAVLNILIPIMAGIAAVTGIYFLIHTFSDRSHESRAAYTVGKQRARHERQVDLVRAIFLFMVALILLGVFGLVPRPAEPLSTETPIPTVDSATAVPTIPSTPSPTIEAAVTLSPTARPSEAANATPSHTPTSEIVETAVPTSTPTPQPQTATVSSGVGVWLRSQPGTDSEQLEWLLDGTIVIVLAETATAENLAWQQVQTGQGLVGWVAVPFITYNQ